MSTDSTSSEDDYDRLKEAIDGTFLNEDLFTAGKSKKESQSQSKPISLRYQSHQETNNNPFSIKVTPEFQKHVSKHLSRLLDDIIDDKEILMKSRKLKKNCSNGGIKLLSSSKDYLVCNSNHKEAIKPKKFSTKGHSYENDYKKKAKEVAVTAEWVLSQEETRHWAPNTKGELEIVKFDDCNKNFKHFKNKKKKPDF